MRDISTNDYCPPRFSDEQKKPPTHPPRELVGCALVHQADDEVILRLQVGQNLRQPQRRCDSLGLKVVPHCCQKEALSTLDKQEDNRWPSRSHDSKSCGSFLFS